MKYFIPFLKIVVGLILLLMWGVMTLFVTAAAFGSYFANSAVGFAFFLGPLFTVGRHLLQSLRVSYAPTRALVVADYVADMFLTAALSSFLTHLALGHNVSSPYLGIGFALALTAAGIQALVRSSYHNM